MVSHQQLLLVAFADFFYRPPRRPARARNPKTWGSEVRKLQILHEIFHGQNGALKSLIVEAQDLLSHGPLYCAGASKADLCRRSLKLEAGFRVSWLPECWSLWGCRLLAWPVSPARRSVLCASCNAQALCTSVLRDKFLGASSLSKSSARSADRNTATFRFGFTVDPDVRKST